MSFKHTPDFLRFRGGINSIDALAPGTPSGRGGTTSYTLGSGVLFSPGVTVHQSVVCSCNRLQMIEIVSFLRTGRSPGPEPAGMLKNVETQTKMHRRIAIQRAALDNLHTGTRYNLQFSLDGWNLNGLKGPKRVQIGSEKWTFDARIWTKVQRGSIRMDLLSVPKPCPNRCK